MVEGDGRAGILLLQQLEQVRLEAAGLADGQTLNSQR